MQVTPVLFSVSYAGLWGQQSLSLEKFIAKAARLGYPAVQLMGKRPHMSVLDTDESSAADIKALAKKHKVEIATVAAYNDFTAGGHAREVPFVEMQVAYIRRLAQLAKVLGAKLIRIFTGYSTDLEGYASDWNVCVKAVRECAEAAEEYGVIIGVQNHHDVAVGSRSYIEFLNDVNHKNCKAMFDPWSPALNGEDLYSYAKELAPRMVQTTLADYSVQKRFKYCPGLVHYKELTPMAKAVPVGDGDLDLAVFFKGLADGGFNGYTAYEMCSPLRGGGSMENLDRTAKKSLEKMKELVRDAGGVVK
jgi:sugar phosphate isomerase/epimerase